jgi:hypothetical protein
MFSRLRQLGPLRVAGILVLGFVVAGAAAAALLLMAIPSGPVPVNVRWKPDVTSERRAALESELHLTEGHLTEGTTWAYLLTEPSGDRIRTLIQHPSVDDTAHLNRVRFRPAFEYDRERRVLFYSGVAGAIGALAFLIQVVRRRPA